MYSASRGIRAVSLFLVSCFTGTAALAQGVNFIRRVADPPPLSNLPASRTACTRVLESAVLPPVGAFPATDGTDAACDVPPITVPLVNPCNAPIPAKIGCGAPRDFVPANLEVSGKRGQQILSARERVLDILQIENACSAWFREKDLNPAETFRTLNIALDDKGEEYILESRDSDSMHIYHDPYVAKVTQDSGAYAMIMLNAQGAFFRSEARIVVTSKEGGPFTMRGARYMKVGAYAGGTLSAQVLTLLHEFGHVLDLLPVDLQDADGKSVQNSHEVLRYCRSAIESKPARNLFSASR